MSQDKIKITLNEAIGLINYLNNLPIKERVSYETLAEDLNQMGINGYTHLYMTKDQSIEVDKQQIFLLRIKYGL